MFEIRQTSPVAIYPTEVAVDSGGSRQPVPLEIYLAYWEKLLVKTRFVEC